MEACWVYEMKREAAGIHFVWMAGKSWSVSPVRWLLEPWILFEVDFGLHIIRRTLYNHVKCEELGMYFHVASEGKKSVIDGVRIIQMDSLHPLLFLKRYLSLIWVYSLCSAEVNWIFTGFLSFWSSGQWIRGRKLQLKPLSKLNIICWLFQLLQYYCILNFQTENNSFNTKTLKSALFYFSTFLTWFLKK